jgi:regulator of protease activity HflC (stomatin/prohibitin superfamily)
MEIIVLAVTAAIIVVIILTILYLSVRVVQQYEKMVVFRLGRTNESLVREPGLRFLIPIIDRPVKVEIREITPPRDVQDAMNRQLSAERTRRAVITESEGSRQAAINVAEGQKQAEILKAEGDRQAAILRAEGFSEALTRIFNAASGVDEKTMALQYLEALKAIGASPSTKYVIPAEVTRWVEPLSEYVAKGLTPPEG